MLGTRQRLRHRDSMSACRPFIRSSVFGLRNGSSSRCSMGASRARNRAHAHGGLARGMVVGYMVGRRRLRWATRFSRLCSTYSVTSSTAERRCPKAPWRPCIQPRRRGPADPRSRKPSKRASGHRRAHALERGGKAGFFGGAGVGKTVLLTETIYKIVGITKA